MTFKMKLFAILWLAGMVGVLSILLIDLSAVIASLPVRAGTKIPPITPALKLLTLVQPGILLILAVLLGVALAPKVRLSSPIAEAAASGRQLRRPLLPQIIPGLLGGMMGGVAIVLTAQLWKPLLAPEVIARIAGFGKLLPVPTRLLYGGITEELLMRWALMTVLVWAIWRLFQKGRERPNSSCYVSAILISSVVFGVGHLPVAFLVVPNVTLSLDQCRVSKRTHPAPVGSVTRVAEPNIRSRVARIVCRNAGVEVLRWGTRNGNPNGPSLWQTMIKESGLSATLKPLGTCLLHTWCWQANSTVRGRPFTSRRSHLLRTSAVQSTGHILVSSRNRTCSVQCPHGSSTLALVAICKRRRFG